MLSNIKISARERFIQTPEIEAEVISAGLNVRTGPGVNFSVIKEISRGERVDILGRLNNWYLIQTSSGKVGVVYGDFLRITRFEEITTHEGYTNDSTCPSNTDEEVLFSITNKTRLEKGLTPFAWCENLNNIARLKAEDMVKHNYFGHYSPIFGTPFRMLRDMGIVHRGASENILSNKDMHAAHEMVLGSPPHKGNILSPRFNKMGVGIAESETYGKIIVQIFIQE
ncbi:MAG: SH3 domain-containing protein [Defluviitaleaceae bacterium]|nr:SH3 domain-containing protein [Defluviitaleaceae bacterium]